MSGGFRSRTKSAQKQPSKPARTSTREKAPQTASQVKAMGDKAREVVFDVLLRVAVEDAYGNLVLPQLLRERSITGRDAAFATELAYGAMRTQGVLDAVIRDCSSRPLADLDPSVLTALRIGVYQLLYTRVDAHAAVDTSVRLVEAAGHPKAKGFVNGILRTVTRTEPAQWIKKLSPADPLAAVAFHTAHPEWIARSFATALGVNPTGAGAEELEKALVADSERPVVHLVARPGELSAEELALTTGGEEGKYSPYAVYLESGDPGALQPVRDRMAAVQDEGSQLIARAVTEVPVESDAGRWLDLCAGPGGKAALMGAIAAIDGAHVDAVEVSSTRADLIRKTTQDLPVTVHVGDGRNPGLEPGYDRVLVDAPCSGLGALRRRPEARWRKAESDIAELNVLQEDLLASAIELTKPGGIVVYSTCSPDVRETRGIIDKALTAGAVEELNAHEFTCGMEGVGPHRSVQMWPHRHGTDAMFFAVLRKQ